MTYADTFNIRTSGVKANDIADALDGLCASITVTTGTGAINSTSTTMVDTGLTSTISTNTNESVLALSWFNFSCSAAGKYGVMTLAQDGTVTGVESYLEEPSGSTNGAHHNIAYFFKWAPSAGSHTYKMQYRIDSAGTVYSDRRSMVLIVLQTS